MFDMQKIGKRIVSLRKQNNMTQMDEDGVAKLAMEALNSGQDVAVYIPYMDEDDVKELLLEAMMRKK